jgi:hypothetical protein
MNFYSDDGRALADAIVNHLELGATYVESSSPRRREGRFTFEVQQLRVHYFKRSFVSKTFSRS